ncbi:MAG: 50S ribosomal protein L13 [Candidatus Levybacteria bacterium]|nr:50S ribosomal protein L13 [Candidatus Levybacteria bacterium]
MKTVSTKASEIKREKHVIDVKGKVLGRVSTEIAQLLMGKAKPYFVRNLDLGDFVTVINAKEVSLSGKKETDKKYYRYSGYPGGLTIETADKLRIRKPTDLVRHAVKGMLPQNKLRDTMLKRLVIYAGEEK